MNDSMILFDALEYNDAVSRPLFHGASLFHIQHPDRRQALSHFLSYKRMKVLEIC